MDDDAVSEVSPIRTGPPPWAVGAIALILVGVGIYALSSVVLDPAGRPHWLDSWYYLGLESAACLVLLARPLLVRSGRLPWSLLTAAFACVVVGDVFQSRIDASGASSGAPLVATALYACYMVLALAGVIILLRPHSASTPFSGWLDGVIAVLGMTAIGSAALFRPSERIDLDELATLGWNIGQLVLVAVLVGALTASGRVPTRLWWTLVAVFTLAAVCNILIAPAMADGSYRRGGLVDAGWPLATAVLAAGAWSASGRGARLLPLGPTLTLAIPVGFTTAAIVVVMADQFARQSAFAVVMALLTLLAGLGRLGISLKEAQLLRAEAVALAVDLEVARDEALAGITAKSAFLATMSHEIRTPMNAVIGMTALLSTTRLDAVQRDYVDSVRMSGDLLLEVIDHILDFSKIEAGELELESRDFDLVGCVDDTVGLLAVTADEKSLLLLSDVASGCPDWVTGDPTRLRQVLVNLVGNALKFTERGRITVSVHPAADPVDERPAITFSVADTGIGIPEDRIDRIFQSFSQVDSSTTRLYGGTGLGLAISTALVEQMGGRLTVDSIVGEGSRFSFTIPLDAAEPPHPPAALPEALTALILERDDQTADILVARLAGWGIGCRRVRDLSGLEAELEGRTAAGAPDLLLVDLLSAGVGPEHLVRLLAGDQDWEQSALVLLAPLTEVLESTVAAPSATVLVKPVRTRDLRRMLVRISDGSPTGPVADDGPETATTPRGLDLLLAEDNAINQKVAQHLLLRAGHRVRTVSNGREAVDAVREERFDAVLMDMHMPVMDGLESARTIRALGDSIVQPFIVALTASVTAEDRRACLRAGMDDFLSKPMRVDALVEVFGRIVASASSVPEPALAPAPAPAPAPDPSLGVLDLEQFEALDDLGEELKASMLDRFVTALPERIEEIRAAAVAGDHAALAFSAHKLRGSSATMGGARLTYLCGALEGTAKAGGLPDDDDWAQFLEAAVRLGSELRHRLMLGSVRG